MKSERAGREKKESRMAMGREREGTWRGRKENSSEREIKKGTMEWRDEKERRFSESETGERREESRVVRGSEKS